MFRNGSPSHGSDRKSFENYSLIVQWSSKYTLNIVEIGAKHHNPNPILIDTIKDVSNIL
jgi:hypothetical protein